MAMEVFLCKVNYSWQKAGSAAGFASLEVVLVTRKQGVYQCQKKGGILEYCTCSEENSTPG